MNLFERTAKINACAGVFAALAGASALGQGAAGGGDLWLRLAAGREIWARAGVPAVDSFSFTFGGRAWRNAEWLFDLLAYGAYSVHPQLLAWLQFGLLLGALALLLWIALRRGASLLASGAALWLAGAVAGPFLAIAPASSALLPLALLLALREFRRGPWAWPAVLVLWANLDASFALGALALLIDAGGDIAQASRRSRRLAVPTRAWLGLASCAAALVLNPQGPGVLAAAGGALAPGGAFQQGLAWRAPGFALDPAHFAGRFAWLCLAAGAGAVLAARREPRAALLAVALFALAARSRALIPFFAVAALPLAAEALERLLSGSRARWPALDHPAAPVAAALGALCATGWLWSGVRVHPDLLGRWTDAGSSPAGAACFLRALDPAQRILNRYSWGGYLVWQLPDSRVFIDGRGPALYDEDLLDDYAALAEGRVGSRALLMRYEPQVAVLAAGARSPLLERGWRVLYQDTVAQLLIPEDSPLRAPSRVGPKRACGHEPQTMAWRAAEEHSVEIAQAAIRRAPLLLPAYATLANLAAERRDADGIAAALEAGLRAYPRRARALYEIAGRAYEQAGYLPRALHAYRRALPAGPLENAAARRAHVRSLEARLRPQERGRDDG